MTPTVRFIAFSEMAAGVLMIVGSAYGLSSDATSASVNFLTLPFVAGAITTVAGAFLMLREPLGLYLSFLVQGLQILNFGAPARLVYLAGLKASLVIFNTGVYFSGGGGGAYAAAIEAPNALLEGSGAYLAFTLGFAPSPITEATWSVSVNFVAVTMLRFLWRHANDPAVLDDPAPPSAVSDAV